MPRKGGRGESDARQNERRPVITFRVTPAEFDEIQASAAPHGQSPGEYARTTAVGGTRQEAAGRQAAYDDGVREGAAAVGRERAAEKARRDEREQQTQARLASLQDANASLTQDLDDTVAALGSARREGNTALVALGKAQAQRTTDQREIKDVHARVALLRTERNEALLARDAAGSALDDYKRQDAVRMQVLEVEQKATATGAPVHLEALARAFSVVRDEHRAATQRQIAEHLTAITEPIERVIVDWRTSLGSIAPSADTDTTALDAALVKAHSGFGGHKTMVLALLQSVSIPTTSMMAMPITNALARIERTLRAGDTATRSIVVLSQRYRENQDAIIANRLVNEVVKYPLQQADLPRMREEFSRLGEAGQRRFSKALEWCSEYRELSRAVRFITASDENGPLSN